MLGFEGRHAGRVERGVGHGRALEELTERYPPYQICHRRFPQWIRSGKLAQVLKLLAALLHGQDKLELDEAFVDATFASANRGLAGCSTCQGKTRIPAGLPLEWKGTKIIAVAVDHSLPRRICPEHNIRPGARLSKKRSPEVLWMSYPRLIGDKVYDSNGLNDKLAAEYGIKLIAPNCRKKRKPRWMTLALL